MTGVLQWRDAGSLGRAGWVSEEEKLPFMGESSWSVWSSACGQRRSRLRDSLWVRMKERTGKGDIIMAVSYRPPDQEEQVNQAFYRQMGAASHSQTLVLVGDFNHPNICWRDNTASHKQSRRFLECIDDNYLL